jgi:CheY-like chemotaxis protein
MMREPLDLVLMDRHMPELDGLETTRRWREFEKQKGGHLRIVAVTASVLAEDVEACRAAGMDEVLSKPLSFGRLETLIRATAAPRARLMA